MVAQSDRANLARLRDALDQLDETFALYDPQDRLQPGVPEHQPAGARVCTTRTDL